MIALILSITFSGLIVIRFLYYGYLTLRIRSKHFVIQHQLTHGLREIVQSIDSEMPLGLAVAVISDENEIILINYDLKSDQTKRHLITRTGDMIDLSEGWSL